MKIQEILTNSFFYRFAQWYDGEEYEDVKDYFETFQTQFYHHVVLNYDGLQCWDYLATMSTNEISEYAFSLLGENIARIYNALVVNYNPLENYFTDRTMNTDRSNTQTKTGNKDVQKMGIVATTSTGTKERTYTNHSNTGAATTFEDPATFRDVSKDTMTGSIRDGYVGYGTNTIYGAAGTPLSEKTIYDTSVEDSGGEDITENRSGNSGIFSKQDLTQRELTLRQTNLFMKTAVRMFVDAFNTGVWE